MPFPLEQLALARSKHRLLAQLVDLFGQRQLSPNLDLNILILVLRDGVLERARILRELELLEFSEGVFVAKDGSDTRFQEESRELGS